MLNALLHLLLVPPTSLLVLIVLGLALRRRWPRTGATVQAGGILALLLLSTNAGALLLVRPLERLTTPLAYAGKQGAQAIVVLAAGNLHRAAEYDNGDVPDEIALVRLRYAARLQHQTGLPLLVSGGNQDEKRKIPPKAVGMAQALREDFHTPVTWIEDQSEDTAQNAQLSAAILRAAGVKKILLVTHAMHMARAERAFRAAGLEVVAAPTMFYGNGDLALFMFIPSWSGMYRSWYATHELLGLLWYRIRPQAPPTPAAPRSST